jgi:lysophospholipase L1-like esterase
MGSSTRLTTQASSLVKHETPDREKTSCYLLKMRTFFIFALMSFFVLPLCFSTQALAMIKAVKIMPLGDSITEGGYNENGQWKTGGGYRVNLYDRLTADRVPFHFVGSLTTGNFPEPRHEGHSGWTIQQLSDFVGGAIATYQPDVVLLMIGTNDVLQNDNLSTAPDRLADLIKKIAASDSKTKILLSTILTTNNPVVNKKIHAYNNGVRRVAHALAAQNIDIHFVDLYTDSGVGGGRADLIDGVHPTPRGYKKLGVAWYQALKTLLGRQ